MIIPARYKCDKCGVETESNIQFWIMEVRIMALNTTLGNTAKNKNGEMSQGVCRMCLESYGIFVQDKEKEKITTYPTTEELILEILEKCGIYPTSQIQGETYE